MDEVERIFEYGTVGSVRMISYMVDLMICIMIYYTRFFTLLYALLGTF